MSHTAHQGHYSLGWLGGLFLLAGALIMAAPFYFMFVFSTQARADIFSLPPPMWFGPHFFNNLDILMGKIPFWKNLGWSIYVGFMSTGLTLLFCTNAVVASCVVFVRSDAVGAVGMPVNAVEIFCAST